MAEILRFGNSSKTQKSKYLANEALFPLQMKSIHYTFKGYMTKKFSGGGNL